MDANPLDWLTEGTLNSSSFTLQVQPTNYQTFSLAPASFLIFLKKDEGSGKIGTGKYPDIFKNIKNISRLSIVV